MSDRPTVDWPLLEVLMGAALVLVAAFAITGDWPAIAVAGFGFVLVGHGAAVIFDSN